MNFKILITAVFWCCLLASISTMQGDIVELNSMQTIEEHNDKRNIPSTASTSSLQLRSKRGANSCSAVRWITYAMIYEFVNRMRLQFLQNNDLIQEVRTDYGYNRITILRATIRQKHLNKGGAVTEKIRKMVQTSRDAYPGDDSGHIIARRLGGPAVWYNIIPQNPTINRGPYRSMEDMIYTWVNGGHGRYAEMHVRLDYGANRPRRPEQITYFVRLMHGDGTEHATVCNREPNPPRSPPPSPPHNELKVVLYSNKTERTSNLLINEAPQSGTGGVNEASKCGKRVIGYYPSWGKEDIKYEHARHFTHLIFAFFETDADGNVFLGSADRTHSTDVNEDTRVAKYRLSQLLRFQRSFPNLKIMFAVGGWENSQYFSSIAATPTKRLRFIASTLKILDEYKLDGIDIDWEHPATGGAVEGTPHDKQNYVQFMREIRQAFDGHKTNLLLSFAGAAGQWTLDPGYDLPNLLKYANFVNIMTYDFFGAWASKWGAYTGPPAPLYFGMPAKFSGKTNVDWTVKYYMCKTKEPHKINMGVPFYGRYWKNVPSESIDPNDGMWRKAEQVGGRFEGGAASWKEIKETWLTNSAYKQATHDKTKTSYAYNEQERTFLGYESPQSLKFKMEYAAEKNVGGVMIWAIDQDDSELSLLKIVVDAQLCQHTDSTWINYKCSPLDEKRWWTTEDSDDKAGLCGRSAPLYKGFYPLCDPDDPGYSCCGEFGYCGSGSQFCSCPTCIDYAKNPDKLIEEPIRPTINPVQWYFLDAPDGQRGRCGRDVPQLNGNIIPICNPDDQNAFCCSNGGYCGATPAHCQCDGCINFKTNPNYRFKTKQWWSWSDGPNKSGRCGEKAEKINGLTATCDPDSKDYCCSKHGFCGSGDDFCNCDGCVNYRNT